MPGFFGEFESAMKRHLPPGIEWTGWTGTSAPSRYLKVLPKPPAFNPHMTYGPHMALWGLDRHAVVGGFDAVGQAFRQFGVVDGWAKMGKHGALRLDPPDPFQRLAHMGVGGMGGQ